MSTAGPNHPPVNGALLSQRLFTSPDRYSGISKGVVAIAQAVNHRQDTISLFCPIGDSPYDATMAPTTPHST